MLRLDRKQQNSVKQLSFKKNYIKKKEREKQPKNTPPGKALAAICKPARGPELGQTPRPNGRHSHIMVVPPARAALVPWQKSSAGVMPRTGISSRVWTSTPPGRTSRPWASMVLMPPGTMRFSPICLKATETPLVRKSPERM